MCNDKTLRNYKIQKRHQQIFPDVLDVMPKNGCKGCSRHLFILSVYTMYTAVRRVCAFRVYPIYKFIMASCAYLSVNY